MICGWENKWQRRDKALADEIEAESKRQRLINWESPEKIRYNERTTAFRENITLKQACLELDYLSVEQFDEIVKPENMV